MSIDGEASVLTRRSESFSLVLAEDHSNDRIMSSPSNHSCPNKRLLRPSHKKRWVGLMALLLLSQTACRNESVNLGEPFAGTVVVEGKPLEIGRITLRPMLGTPGPVTSSLIEQGRFKFPRKQGPWPGKHMVIIETIPKSIIAMAEGQAPEQTNHAQGPDQQIADIYNRKSQLHVTIQSGASNEQEFAVTWQAP